MKVMRSTGITLAIVGFCCLCSSRLGLTQSANPVDKKTEVATSKQRFIPPTPPDTLTAPGKRSSAGSRDPGGKLAAEQVVAIVPEFERVIDFLPIPQVWVLTSTPRPTFWFYVQHLNGATLDFQIEQVQASASNEKYPTIYQKLLPISSEGMVAITLPESFAGLKEGELYRWSLRSVKPGGRGKSSALPAVKGWVQVRALPPQLLQQLAAATPSQTVNLYAQNGIWLDGFTALARLYERDPNTYRARLRSLLTEIGLQEVIQN